MAEPSPSIEKKQSIRHQLEIVPASMMMACAVHQQYCLNHTQQHMT